MNEIFELINKAEEIFNSDENWEYKYDTIFGMKIGRKIRDLGYYFDYYDPDTSYEEDITAYMNALRDFRKDNEFIAKCFENKYGTYNTEIIQSKDCPGLKEIYLMFQYDGGPRLEFNGSYDLGVKIMELIRKENESI